MGFEYRPRSEAQTPAVKKSIETLKAGEALLVLPSGAEGGLARSKMYTDIASDSDRKSKDARTHEHNKISKKDKEVRYRHQKNHESDKHESHSEFKAEYHFVCKNPEKLAHIDVMQFSVFPGIEHIEVQLSTGTEQAALELTAKKKQNHFLKIKFKSY